MSTPAAQQQLPSQTACLILPARTIIAPHEYPIAYNYSTNHEEKKQQSGAFAVVITDFMVYPFDTLKTRLQSPDYATVYKDATTGQIKRGMLFKGLYQGVGSVVLATIPACRSALVCPVPSIEAPGQPFSLFSHP